MSNSVVHAMEIGKRQDLKKEIASLRKALEFYANGAWPTDAKGKIGGVLNNDQTGEPDFGDVARKALRGE